MNNTISIVTPSYNQGQFIEQTINSVLSQEGNFYIDYIISDGGSIDNSVEIIKKYNELLKTKKYPIKCRGISYRWWSEKDKGQSHAINKGFKIAKGDILAWINSDDVYESGAFNYIIRKFKENPNISLLYGDIYFIEEATEKTTLMKSQQMNLETLLSKNLIYQPSTFFTKDLIQRIGYLDENLHYPMDYDFWIRTLEAKEKVLYCPKALSKFRIWTESKTSPQKEKDLFNGPTKKKEVKDRKIYTFNDELKNSEYLLCRASQPAKQPSL